MRRVSSTFNSNGIDPLFLWYLCISNSNITRLIINVVKCKVKKNVENVSISLSNDKSETKLLQSELICADQGSTGAPAPAEKALPGPGQNRPNYRGSDRGFALWSTLFKLQNIFKNYQYLK